MANYKNEKNQDYDYLLGKIQALENRLTSLESMLRVEWLGKEGEKSMKSIGEEYTVEGTESRIVEYGLAWLGCIVLIFGIVFMMSYFDSLGFLISSRIIAYLSTLVLIGFAYYYRNSFPILVNVLIICIPLLFYYITLHLYFFSENQIISNKGIELLILILLIAIQVYLAIRKDSEFLGTIAIFFLIATAIIFDTALITFIILMITALFSLVLYYRKLWWRMLMFSLFMVYLTHLIWLLNNPIMGNPMKAVEMPQHNILFLFGYGIIYSLTIFIPQEKIKSNGQLISTAIWNALSFSFLLFMIILSFYKDNYAFICITIASFCILFAVILKLKSSRIFAPATYACFGFMALSGSIYGYSGLPDAYFLLVLQSFLVVSMALWFKSKIIVVVNSFLFVLILLHYLMTSESVDLINFSFAFTALATARILNWKKERLTLKTELYRNIFLFVGFIMILYSLSHALHNHYVTLAWTATAICFFLLSILLKNIKYRYLSIMTIVVTGGHLFFIDLASMEIGFRVIAFLVFAIITLGVSLYYTKRIRKKQDSQL